MFGSDLKFIASTAQGATFACPGLAACRFWGGTSMPEVDCLEQAIDLAAADGQPFAFLISIDDDGTAPDRESRGAIGELLAARSDQMQAWSACVMGTGLGASSKRTMMRLIMSLGRVRCPWVVVPSPPEAVAWLGETLAESRGACATDHWVQQIEAARAEAPAERV